MMRTVQMTLDDDLVKAVDKVARKLRTTRSGFTRAALRKAIDEFNARRLEERHRQGYEEFPVAADEFSVWEDEQAWGD